MAHTRTDESARRGHRPAAWSRVLTAASALLLAAGLASGCAGGDRTLDGAAGQGQGQIVVGAGDGAESRILAEIYAGALRSTGAPVTTDDGLGDRTAYLGQLDAGSVTLVPEFTGRLLRYYDPESTETEQEDVFEALSKALPQGLSISDFAAAEDRSALAVTPQISEQLGLTTLDDLVPSCGKSTAVLAPAFEADALAGLTGCTFAQTTRVADDAAAVGELAVPAPAGGAVVAGVTTSSPDVADTDLVLLSDDEHVFTAQNVVPLFRIGTLSEAQLKALNVVAGELTTADLADMIGQFRGGADSADVARVWLDAHL
ncbi:ABC transporter substrate-binding protein [Rhodococcus koreensis]|uniref:Osmoprotectant transport system substrate-binding protein n=1 Tax=Rhodococcus koreensis TaxID=99653 RepID=A0A1H4PRB1_9NOCA|nr:ABC transporter substrate-binding protein [Rhodococcus koreensis]SEC09778.1 osmoprotectant transport system substrate-binding protein [Rhodococcus koreensis]